MPKHVDLKKRPNMSGTVILYLNSLKDSGETVLYENDEIVKVSPKKGTALVFDISLPHEGLPLTQTKYIVIAKILSS